MGRGALRSYLVDEAGAVGGYEWRPWCEGSARGGAAVGCALTARRRFVDVALSCVLSHDCFLPLLLCLAPVRTAFFLLRCTCTAMFCRPVSLPFVMHFLPCLCMASLFHWLSMLPISCPTLRLGCFPIAPFVLCWLPLHVHVMSPPFVVAVALVPLPFCIPRPLLLSLSRSAPTAPTRSGHAPRGGPTQPFR